MPTFFEMVMWFLAFDAVASLVMWFVSPWFREQVDLLGHLLNELFRRF